MIEKMRVRKNINQRDEKFNLEGSIELKNSLIKGKNSKE